ncbi:MAG: HlyD family efflux transporter periplasmic adaptor subunit [Pseudomonadota bacterium]
MRFLRHSLSGLFMLALSLGLLAYAGYGMFTAFQERAATERETPERREREFLVAMVTAEPGTITPVLTAYGEVQSRRMLEIRAKSSGTLVELSDAFENGGVVKAGELLAVIDPTDAKFALSRAESELTDAIAEKREAERALSLARDESAASVDQAALREKAFERQADLETRGVGTAAAVEAAELAASQARQLVIVARKAEAAAEARLDQAETRITRAEIARDEAAQALDDTRIFAKFDGTLSDVTVVEGGFVSINEQLGMIVDGNALDVSFRVSTAQYARLTDDEGRLRPAPVRVTLSSFGATFSYGGRISRDSAAVGEGQIGRLVFARLDDAPALKPGDFVTVEIEEPALADVVRLPSAALGSDGNVMVLGAQSRLKAVPVTLLRRQGNEVLVRGEALDGAQVLTDRTPLLGAGVKVQPRVVEPDRPAALQNLTDAQRARLIAFVKTGLEASEEVKAELLGQLQKAQVPAALVARLEQRIGG